MDPPDIQLPSELVNIIAGQVLDLDKGDRMFVILTKLLRPSRIPCPWRTHAENTERPLRWSFELCEPRVSTISTHCWISWTPADESVGAALAESGHGLDVMVYGPTGRKPLEAVKRSSVWVASYTEWIATFKDYTLGQYTVDIRWNKNIPAKITLACEHCNGVNGIDSFGTQNVHNFWMRPGIATRDHYLPFVLSPHIRELQSFSASGPAFRCRSIEYWDVSRVTSFDLFMNGTVNWRGDLSRWRLSEHATYKSAFVECAAVAWPPKYHSRSRRPWTDEFFVVHSKWYPRLTVALFPLVICSVAVLFLLEYGRISPGYYPLVGFVPIFSLIVLLSYWKSVLKRAYYDEV
jgi:hypothetical protein